MWIGSGLMLKLQRKQQLLLGQQKMKMCLYLSKFQSFISHLVNGFLPAILSQSFNANRTTLHPAPNRIPDIEAPQKVWSVFYQLVFKHTFFTSTHLLTQRHKHWIYQANPKSGLRALQISAVLQCPVLSKYCVYNSWLSKLRYKTVAKTCGC